MPEPLFETNASASIKRVTATFGQRGTEYGDTWRNAQWLCAKAVALELGISLTTDHARKIAAAVLVDVKYQRLEGGYKDDSVIDGIAYASNLAEEMRQKPAVAPTNIVCPHQRIARVGDDKVCVDCGAAFA